MTDHEKDGLEKAMLPLDQVHQLLRTFHSIELIHCSLIISQVIVDLGKLRFSDAAGYTQAIN